MIPLRSMTRGAVLAALALASIGAGSAAADTTVVADPTARNVTAYGTTAAWSRRAADGYHLVVAQGATVADAPVPVSSKPYDPDLGPTSSNGRAIVYARGGDIYRFDVGTERRAEAHRRVELGERDRAVVLQGPDRLQPHERQEPRHLHPAPQAQADPPVQDDRAGDRRRRDARHRPLRRGPTRRSSASST